MLNYFSFNNHHEGKNISCACRNLFAFIGNSLFADLLLQLQL